MLSPTVTILIGTICSCFDYSHGFNGMSSTSTIHRPFARIAMPPPRTILFSSTDDKPKEPESLSFDKATQALRDEEDAERAERSGNTVSDEAIADFEAKSAAYDDMRSKIRSRASSLNIEKSVTTAQAIAEANARANIGEKPQLDLSKVTAGFGSNEEDELTEEEMKEIDKVGNLPIWEQALDEFKNTKFPTVGATLRQAGFMLVIFVVTASFILYLDNLLRELVTGAGLIPRSDEVFDFSDLALPDKWDEFMNEDDLMK